ncbi:ABC transporter substrate-binding protein [Microbacterium sp. 18062]|uniref:ABC transporter substrate-binding protein n=1 Tax=Microbacterium sp. 18062 TaxID=2681410 RepID=UPI001356EA88|nr:ABC transporter substrate-binding protein [Microbacterium sp. 18062]
MVSLSLACGAYDRTLPILNGHVRIEGVDLSAIALQPEETFFRMVSHREFDVSEMSFSSYLLTRERGEPFVAIPVFPSKSFRHSGIYVRADAGIERPEDLVGRTVGIPEFQVTAAVWIRGILSDYHGVPADSVVYRNGGLYARGRTEKIAIRPRGIDLQPISAHDTLGEALLGGEVDAVYSPRPPQQFLDGDPRVVRLFADTRAAETAYFRESGIFPIMHTIVIRREVYERDRWIAQSLVKAFTEARDQAIAALKYPGALVTSLPFASQDILDTIELMGEDYWSYGLPANRNNLETLVRYEHEQGLIAERPALEDLFASETLSSVVV